MGQEKEEKKERPRGEAREPLERHTTSEPPNTTSSDASQSRANRSYTEPHLNGTVDITTERLDLRRFKMRDAEALFLWSQDEQHQRFFPNKVYATEQEAADAIASWRAQYKDDSYLLWCMQDAESKQAIGKIAASISKGASCAEIEYSVACWARQKGFATEALEAVIAHLHDAGVQRIQAKIHTSNIASIKTAERAGMQWEGIMRDGLTDRDGCFYDVAVFSHILGD